MVIEFQKLGAFVRRDFLTALTYRMAFVSDWIALLTSAFLFYFTGKLVDTSKLPSYNGTQPTYMQFVIVGIALTIVRDHRAESRCVGHAAGAVRRHPRVAADDADGSVHGAARVGDVRPDLHPDPHRALHRRRRGRLRARRSIPAASRRL